jgi:serine/threonine protein kinase
MNNIENQKLSKEEELELISKGAYGCVYKYPDKNESSKQIKANPEEEFIIKIQKKEKTSENEKLIGKKIMDIKNYNNYFAPVIKSEDINIKIINQDEINKCDFIHDDKNPNTKYESEKIKYVGKETLINYYSDILSTNKQFILIFIENHIILLEALEKLMSVKIVHYDLKENNILIQDTDKRPIIIDFGLSIDTAIPIDEYFYSYYVKYEPWCIDIVFLSYMVNEIGKDWQTKTITQNEIKLIINDYFEQNPVVLKLFVKDEQNIWKSKTENYFNQYINKTWKELYDELINYCFTWDNYSINVMHLNIFYYLDLITYSTNTFLNKYVELLKDEIMEIPSERNNANIMKNKILQLFKSVYKKDLKNLKKILKDQYKKKETIKKVEKNIALSIIEDNNEEKIVYKKQ